MNTLRKIEQFIELCLVPKLNKNYDECKNHSEFGIRNKNLDKNFYLLLKQLEAINFKNCNNPESRYNVTIVPSKILPTSLNLIDDYIIENKLNGLKSCLAILQCLNKDAFEKGNYYEVVYLSLKKLITEKDIEATKLVFECLLTLYHILPANSQKQKLDEIYNAVLDQLIIESNLYRKAECLNDVIPDTKTVVLDLMLDMVNKNKGKHHEYEGKPSFQKE
ncbi:hypothetical protein RR48_12526 [Papilio machaon]|uniref:Uncharacterized protein n=1 Tax=Papilio machaon TaxID=76193 RepID=A0A194RNW6_PAPMA|nr:hypothetical protein RR48_12526 [Papilio machaon]